MNPKKIWRKVFREYFIGDRVELPNYGKGKIVEKELVGNIYLYTIRFDEPYEVDEFKKDKNGRLAPTGKLEKIEEFGDIPFEELEEC